MKELPKIDLPEEWLIGTGVNKELLNLYTNFLLSVKDENIRIMYERRNRSFSQPKSHYGAS